MGNAMKAKRRLGWPSHATVVAYLALFAALGGTGAYAANEWNGSNIQDETLTGADVKGQAANAARGQPFVQGSLTGADVKDNSLTGADVASIAGGDVTDESLTTADIQNFSLGNGDFLAGSVDGRVATDESLTGSDISNNSLTGADVNESTLVGVSDRCHAGALLFGRLCAGGGSTGTVYQALNTCGPIGMRLPTWSEAIQLAANHDVPGVGAPPEQFWTDEVVDRADPSGFFVMVVDENGIGDYWGDLGQKKIVCVETPTNRP